MQKRSRNEVSRSWLWTAQGEDCMGRTTPSPKLADLTVGYRRRDAKIADAAFMHVEGTMSSSLIVCASV